MRKVLYWLERNDPILTEVLGVGFAVVVAFALMIMSVII